MRHIASKAIIIGVVGEGSSGKQAFCDDLERSLRNVKFVRVSFGELIKDDLATGDVPEAFVRGLWRQVQGRERQKPLNAKHLRARALRILGYTPEFTPARAKEIRQSFFAFMFKRFGASYFVNRLESFVRDECTKIKGNRRTVIVLVGDIQLEEEAYWARVHAPLVFNNEPTILIGVKRGRQRPNATPRQENHHDLIELETQPNRIKCDFMVHNNGTLDDLHDEVLAAIAFIGKQIRRKLIAA